jgi:hypothetical protein
MAISGLDLIIRSAALSGIQCILKSTPMDFPLKQQEEFHQNRTARTESRNNKFWKY